MYKVPDSVMVSRVDDEMVFLDMDAGEYFGLNRTGSIFYEILMREQSRDQAVLILAKRFGQSAENIGKDMDELLASLGSRGLIRDA